MALVLGDRVLDNGLSALDTEADKIFVCSALPTTYTEATSTYALGNKNFGAGSAFAAPAAASPGRKTQSVAITDGSVTANGTVSHWAAVDTANSRLLAADVVSGGAAVTSGQQFTLASFAVQMAGTAGGGGATTVIGPLTLASSDGGWANSTIVQLFAVGNLAAATGTQVRLTVQFLVFAATNTAAVYFGRQAVAANAYDFLNTPSHITFAGVDITGDGSTLTYVSDWVTLPEAYDNTKAYLCAADFGSVGGVNLPTNGQNNGLTGNINYFKNGAREASTVDKSGYGGNLTNAEEFITTIEIQ